jgi:hypothetical protein
VLSIRGRSQEMVFEQDSCGYKGANELMILFYQPEQYFEWQGSKSLIGTLSLLRAASRAIRTSHWPSRPLKIVGFEFHMKLRGLCSTLYWNTPFNLRSLFHTDSTPMSVSSTM